MRLFVYGTLMSGMSNHHYLKGRVADLQQARARGLLYHLPYGYPAMVEGDGVVTGELVTLIDPAEILADLDELEDYHGPGNPGNEYERVNRPVELMNGRMVTEAWVYLYCRGEEAARIGRLVKDGDWKKYIATQD